jgi:hypothetical protein
MIRDRVHVFTKRQSSATCSEQSTSHNHAVLSSDRAVSKISFSLFNRTTSFEENEMTESARRDFSLFNLSIIRIQRLLFHCFRVVKERETSRPLNSPFLSFFIKCRHTDLEMENFSITDLPWKHRLFQRRVKISLLIRSLRQRTKN